MIVVIRTNKLFSIFNFVFGIALLCISVTVFAPFPLRMPSEGLDPSWVFGMNQAVTQGLSFGKDIIFTFGPYASVYTKEYYPSIDNLMFIGCLYLAFSYWICLILLARGVSWGWILSFCVALTSMIYSRDTLLFSFPLFVGLTSYKIISSSVFAKSRYSAFYISLLFAPFGLLPLIKGSVFVLCVAVMVLCALFFAVNRRRSFVIVCLLSPFISMLLFWMVSGQPIINLSDYFRRMIPIISGYTEAMATEGDFIEIALYLGASAFLLGSILLQKQISRFSTIFLFCIYFIFLFLAFKAGFVRHDGHAIVSATSILIAAFSVPLVFHTAVTFPVIILSLISCGYILSNHPARVLDLRFDKVFVSVWSGFSNKIRSNGWYDMKFDVAIKSLRAKADFPVLAGTTDIYSFNQSYLIASGNIWSPRPVLQSYSAYTPELVELNKQHLLGANAPDNIIFRVEPIDGRIPSMEDGASWPVLMTRYQPTQIVKDFLFLRRKNNSADVKMEPTVLASGQHSFGEKVSVPSFGQPIFINVEIKPTLLGRLTSTLFKPSQLQITLELENGERKQYRIIAGMAKSGFLLSPLVESTTEFGMLYGQSGYLSGKFVKSFSIAPYGSRSMLWDEKYTVTFNTIKVDPANILKIYKFDQFVEKLPEETGAVTIECEGHIDMINDMPFVSEQLSASGVFKIKGWLVSSITKFIQPETVYVVLTDGKGKRLYLKTQQESRLDVGDHFKNPELNNSGYTAIADLNGLEGLYTLGLAIKQPDKIRLCTKFDIPLTISKVDHYTEK